MKILLRAIISILLYKRMSASIDACTDAAGATCADTSSESEGSCSEPEPPQATPAHLDSSASTLEVNNPRGRRRTRARKDAKRRGKGLRTKFEIEALYVEIAGLRRQNEVLRQILEDVRGAPGGKVPRMVQISDRSGGSDLETSNRSGGSDLELSTSDRVAYEEGGGNGGEGGTDDNDEMQMEMQRVFNSLVLDKSSSGA